MLLNQAEHQTVTLVSIVNYRTPGDVTVCLDSLLPEIQANPGSSAIVVDNDSQDGSVEQIRQHIADEGYQDWCRLVAAPRNGGFAYGNNLAMAVWGENVGVARGESGSFPDFVWLLNPDAIVLPGALGGLLAFMKGCPDAGIAGGRALCEDGSVRSCGFRFPSVLSELGQALSLGNHRRLPGFAAVARLLARHAMTLPRVEEPTRVDWVNGSTFMVRGSVLEKIGTFDEGYFLYWEETDFCLRAVRAGFSCWYVPDSRIIHAGGKSTGVDWTERRPVYWFESRARFFRKRYGPGRWHAVNLPWLLASPLGWLLARLRGRRPKWPPFHWLDVLRYSYRRPAQ
jgi:GT2 family glycosyltransferase